MSPQAKLRQQGDHELSDIVLGFTEQMTEQARLLGKVEGQLREIIHDGKNNAHRLESIHVRLAALESDKLRRDGQMSVVQAIMNTKTFGLIMTVAIGVLAYFKGKGEL